MQLIPGKLYRIHSENSSALYYDFHFVDAANDILIDNFPAVFPNTIVMYIAKEEKIWYYETMFLFHKVILPEGVVGYIPAVSPKEDALKFERILI
jgi:hypothetical protein